MSTSEPLQPMLDELRARHGVVGATLGILRGGAIETAGSGVLNLDTGVECTADSVFQIGSIGKVFTATLVMQLVDENRLDLDAPVVKYLRDFTLADRAAARAITVRQLLTHTSGMDGDFFPADDPEGPSTTSYVRKMNLLPSLFAPGQGPVTYCNSGFVTAGRIVEVLTGMTWQNAVMRRICRPLGLPAAFAHPHEALRYRCAMGHVADPKDMKTPIVAPATYLALSTAAAGSVLSMSVESLLKFVGVHFANGEYGGKRPLLSERSARHMREEQSPRLPVSHVKLTHWGLGWFLCNTDAYRMCGHDGGTLGQFTYLRAFPEKGVAFALFTNSPSGKLFNDIESALMPALVGTDAPAEPPAEAWTPDFARYAGRYANIAAEYDIAPEANVGGEGGQLVMRMTNKSGLGPNASATLEPYRPDMFTMRAAGMPFDGEKLLFLREGVSQPEVGDERATFMRVGLRMGRRVS
jgi:CubicO group peptidase (beta-lactamase class C family)